MIPLTFGLNSRGVVVANDLNPYREADQRQPAFICTTVVDSSNKVMAVSVGASTNRLSHRCGIHQFRRSTVRAL